MSKKKRKFCPNCQNKQRIIERLEAQLQTKEIQRIAGSQISRISRF